MTRNAKPTTVNEVVPVQQAPWLPYCQELDEWPRRWRGLPEDLLPGRQIVAYCQPFLVHLSHQKLSRRTIRKPVNNLWVLGGEIIRDLHQTPALRKVPLERLIFDALREGGPLPYHCATRLWRHSTLTEQLGVEDADENDLYAALDWLPARQKRIEKKLAARHLASGDTVLYDVSSSYYEGHHCPLAAFGHSRDRKKGKPIIVYGVLSDSQGRPLAAQVYPGNTGDPATLPAQVDTLRRRFGLQRVVLVGDRGLWTQTQIDNLRQHPGLGWISALRAPALRRLAAGGHLQLSLFDQKNLAEIRSPDYPGERLVACYNPLPADERGRKRSELLEASDKEFERIQAEVARRKRTPLTAAEIGRKVGRVQDRYKMGKHFETTIGEGVFRWERREAAIKREAALDGIYVIRSSEKQCVPTRAWPVWSGCFVA